MSKPSRQTNLAKPTVNNQVGLPVNRNSLQIAHYTGPIPPANELAKYEEAVPGAAERILAMAERQSAHRQSLEQQVVKGEITRSHWGLVAGVSVTVLALGASASLIYLGHGGWAASLFGGALAALVATFVKGTDSRRQEREAKMESVRQQ